MDAVDQAALVKKGEVRPLELLEAAIERIERIDSKLNAVVIRWFDHARDVARGDLPEGPFRGVPFLIKDLFAGYAGQRISNGNLAFKNENVISDADTTLVSRYRAAGLVIAGRTNTPELGSVPTTEPVAWGPTRNPWDTSRSPGGSSGGAAAAVASGMVPFAHASDGGGSIRIPASCCGLVGLKPSQGRTTLGPIRDETALGVENCVSRTVRDTAALLDAVRGPGIGDTVIAPPPTRPYIDEVGAEPGRLRIGLLDHHPQGGAVAPECTAAARSVAALLESLGHVVEQAWPTALEDTTLSSRFAALWSTNMGVSLRRFEEQLGRPLAEDEFEPMNRVQAEFAARFSSIDYALALSATAQFRRSVQAWWAEGWDLLLTPTVAELPLPLGTITNNPDRPMDAIDRAGQFCPFTPPFNMSGQPAINVPVEWTDAGLPVGVQLVAAYGREDVLLQVAGQLEAAKPWAHRTPEV
ncbi:putative amidase AmiC [Mycobacterium heckeshornense]|uniref:amidase n=2 Tax=Mycobacterium heckeshornense TaxID=110505 RepID=A0A7R7TZF0_9MYCO|nr:6-aminohexanoate-cyclic-dimer hydrolase [Mycobacterium heckeshornense]BCQ10990.1 putative amidase AmiC [Mycobacterium heckeshornense]